jgi:DNA-binding beta-propeller fold protein YncE
MAGKGSKVLVAALLLLVSCVKDKPGASNSIITTNGILVLCEGQFSAGNASVYRIDPATGASNGDLYKAANGTVSGDVLQSMALSGSSYWMLLNNSGRISVVDSHTFKQTAVIPVRYPRYMLQVSATLAYVSTLYSNKLFVVNTQHYTVVDSVLLPDGNPEGMCMYNNYLFVATWDTASNAIWKINTTTNIVEQRIGIAGFAPHDILLDAEQKLWVLSGNAVKGRRAAFTRVDPSTGTTLGQWMFDEGVEPIKPVLSPQRDSIYFIEVNFTGGTTANGIYKASLTHFGIPMLPFLPAVQYQYFWSLGIHPATGNIFVGDPKGFNQAGQVFEYSRGGVLLQSYKVGVGPCGFLF